MPKPITLISMQEFKTACAFKCEYNGFVYDPKGILFRVWTRKETYRVPHPSYPNQNSIRFTKGTTFFENQIKKIELSVQDLEGYDFVFDEKGNFLGTEPENDSKRKGQIYIRRFKPAPGKTPAWEQSGIGIDLVAEDIPIQDLNPMQVNPEVYSRIFTHIASLIAGNQLGLLRNGKISIQQKPNIPPGYHYNAEGTYFNMLPLELTNKRPNAFAKNHKQTVLEDNLVVALLQEGYASNLEMFSTIWNVINELICHELTGHIVMDWWGDDYDSHYLTYGYQIGHPTFQYTTKQFQETIKEQFNSQYKISRSEEAKDWGNGRHRILRSNNLYKGWYEYGSERDSIRHVDGLFHRIQDTTEMKRLGNKHNIYKYRRED